MTEVIPEGGAVAEPPTDAGRPLGEAPLALDTTALRAMLRASVQRICPRWLADQSEDLVQVAMMRVLDIQQRREGNAGFSALYLRKAAYCALVDEIRRRRRRREVSMDDEGTELAPFAEAADPERTAISREAGRAIRQCLAAMIRPRRLAVTLYLQGHGTMDVGRLLGWLPKKAENLIYRGLADLRGCLGSKGIER
jgi:RNA polymerase sigma-70 factor (ECF subfamily)